ncbi:hypothetical protein W97_02789 [Coniosporium apollinis CBS 100218]|uniref:Uncharacterized protein n=1 Tax=Coniosporium apollinis (strain CBS 100218) TaxID=1168221 RepID=R7YPI1_CONA1|nr:uncharacterized protein W97_02789 [Coniosporium apollinis CBS 100218]EON63561.1 hypothetical protein W97_02789 [Coniosporium apollinis CBS 100218]
MSTRPDPINGIPRGDARISKPRVYLSLRLRVIPPSAALCVDAVELGQPADVGAPAEIIDDEALHSCSLGSVDYGDLMPYAGRAHNTNGGILPRQCFGQLVNLVRRSDNGYSGWKGRRRLDPGDYGHVKPGAHEGRCDGSTEVA